MIQIEFMCDFRFADFDEYQIEKGGSSYRGTATQIWVLRDDTDLQIKNSFVLVFYKGAMR